MSFKYKTLIKITVMWFWLLWSVLIDIDVFFFFSCNMERLETSTSKYVFFFFFSSKHLILKHLFSFSFFFIKAFFFGKLSNYFLGALVEAFLNYLLLSGAGAIFTSFDFGDLLLLLVTAFLSLVLFLEFDCLSNSDMAF